MPSAVAFDVVVSSLPPTFTGTWNDFIAFLNDANIEVSPDIDWSSFVVGGAEPTSDVGPWLKAGKSWYVWDSELGRYKPTDTDGVAAPYYISEATPPAPAVDPAGILPTPPSIWVKLNSSGAAIGLYYYNATAAAWQDVYAGLAPILANFYTKAETDSAIASAVGGAAFNSAPAAASNTSPQAIPVNETDHKLVLNADFVDPTSAFDSVNSRYIAPAPGQYFIYAAAQVDNDTGVAAGMEVLLKVKKNGAEIVSDGDSTPSPNGARWWPKASGLRTLAANDQIELYLSAGDGTNTGQVFNTVATLNIFRVR